MALEPVEHDPFAGPRFEPVEHDPFAEAPVTAGGLYNALNEGAIKGVAGIGGLPRLAVDLATPAANAMLRQFGLPERQAGTSGLPTATQLEQTIRRDYNQPGWIGPAPTPEPYKPQNIYERGAENVGVFAPNALLPGGPVARALSVAAPAAAVTGTKEMGGGEIAQLAAALAGGYGAARGAQALATRAAPKALTGADVAKAADAGYAAVDKLGVELKPSAVNQAITNIADDLGKAFDSDLAPKTFAVLNRDAAKYAAPEADAMSALTGTQPATRAPVTTMDIDSLRRRLGKVAQGADPTDASAAKIAQRQLDDFIQNVPPTDVLKGDAAALAKTAAEARGNYAAAARHEAFANVIARAELNAARSNSGANVENSLRGEVKNFIRPDNRGASEASRSGFNDAEIALMEKFVRGGAGNTQRIVGNLLGGGGGLGATAATVAGHTLAGPAGFAAPAVGAAIKGFGNAGAMRKAQNILDVILTRSPRAQQLAPQVGAVSSPRDAALLSALQAAQAQTK